MAYIKDNDGGQLLDASQFYYTKDPATGRKILHTRGGGAGGGITSVNGQTGPDVTLTQDDIPAGVNVKQFTDADKTELATATANIANITNQLGDKLDKSGGTMTGNIDMNSHDISGVQKIGINGNNPMFIGSTIEAASDAPRMTPTTDGKVAFVKANTQNDYLPISIGTPTSANDAATKKYVDDAIAGAGGLPPATAAENGKILTVNAQGMAEWQDVPEPYYLVTFAGGYVVVADKTTAQIKDAIAKNKIIIGFFAKTYYQLTYVGDNEIDFGRTTIYGTDTLSLHNNGDVTVSDKAFVNSNQGTATAGKALKVGDDGYVTADGQVVPASTAADADKILSVNATGSPEWKTSDNRFFDVTITENGGVYTSDKTKDEIMAAFEAGKIPTLSYNDNQYVVSEVGGNGVLFTSHDEGYFRRFMCRVGNTWTYSQIMYVNTAQDLGKVACVPQVTTSGSLSNWVKFPILKDGDSGKMLKVSAAPGTQGYELAEAPNGVPTPVAADVSKVLTAKADGTFEWASAGAAQNGIPVGGTEGQVLAKADATDYNCEWKTVAVMPGSTVADAGKVLQVNAAGNAEWVAHLDAGIIQ